MPPGFRGFRHMGPEEVTKRPELKKLWRTFKPFLRHHIAAMTVGTACVFLSMLLAKCQPLFLKFLVDRGLTPVLRGEWTTELYRESLRFILIVITAMVGAGLVSALLASVRTRIMRKAGAQMVRSLRNTLYDHLQRMSLSFFESRRTGDVISRTTGDVSMMEMLITHVGDQFLVETVSLLITVVILFVLNWQLAIVALLPVPILLLLMRAFGRVIRPIYRQIRDHMGVVTAKLQDNLSGIRVIKAFNTEDAEARRFGQANDAFYEKQMEGVRIMATAFPAIRFVQGLGAIGVTAVGGWMLIQRQPQLSLGDLFAFNAYVIQLYQPIGHLFMMFNSVLQAFAAGERISEVFDEQPGIADQDDAVDLPPIEGKVDFDRVSFSYGDEGPVLENVNLHVEPGQTVALVGKSGSGKTTLVNLIPRFYDPTAGRVAVDEYDLREVRKASLRSQIALVLQDPFLFNGTINENIRYAKPEATDDEVRAAAEAANAHEFIKDLPDQYESEIGERGVKLSGGQKQRISIARAVLANRRVLILDEATSMIDTHSELLIQEALERLMRERTTFVIAHRLSTVLNADLILVMEKGRIVEQGSHGHLLEKNGLYAEMFRAQFRLEDDAVRASGRARGGDGPAFPALSAALD